ncbi:hypothetical protein SNEBB_006973 [Seison nebaliae]|nr:hypothetical protein SNEBB_006973 [Seison nebaliae]
MSHYRQEKSSFITSSITFPNKTSSANRLDNCQQYKFPRRIFTGTSSSYWNEKLPEIKSTKRNVLDTIDTSQSNHQLNVMLRPISSNNRTLPTKSKKLLEERFIEYQKRNYEMYEKRMGRWTFIKRQQDKTNFQYFTRNLVKLKKS